jgi:hypothetical protein
VASFSQRCTDVLKSRGAKDWFLISKLLDENVVYSRKDPGR